MTSAKDQIVGLKSIVSTMTDENQQLVNRSKALEEDAAELRQARTALPCTGSAVIDKLLYLDNRTTQRALETTVEK